MTRGGLAALVLVCACHDNPRAAPDSVPSVPAPSSSAMPSVDASLDAGLPSRCTTTPGKTPTSPFGAKAELGESVSFRGGYAIGALRAGEAGRAASIVFANVPAVTTVDLGSSWGDSPPPQPFVHGDDLYAAGYVRRAAKPLKMQARALSIVHALATDPTIELPQESDTSAAYDVLGASPGAPIGGLVAWDDLGGPQPMPWQGEDIPRLEGTSHSIIRLATLTADVHGIHATHAYPATPEEKLVPADASDPRLAHRGDGYWLVWLGHRPERVITAPPVPAGEIEVPSQEATFGWIEAAMLDAQGERVGKPKRLTSATGHIGDFAVDAGTSDNSLLILAEDDGSSGTVGGGRLEQVTWKGEGAPEVTHLVQGGVAEDSPPMIIGEGTKTDRWLAFRDVHGDAELVPLLPGLGHTGLRPSPTVEALLGRSRILGTNDAKLIVAVASEDGGGWELRTLACAR